MKLKNLLAVSAAVLMLGTDAFAAQDINVSLNGEIINFSAQKPVVLNGRTLIPLRGVFDKMGYTIAWNGNTKTASLANGTNEINVVIGESTLHINGKSVPIDVPAQIINGSTMLPLRAVADATGADVGWDPSAKLVTITYDKPNNQSSGGAVITQNQQELDYVNAYTSTVEAFSPVIDNFSAVCLEFTSYDMGDQDKLVKFAQPAKNVHDAAVRTKNKLDSLSCPPKFAQLNRTASAYAQAIAEQADVVAQRAEGKISAEECVERYNSLAAQTVAKETEYRKAVEAVIAAN